MFINGRLVLFGGWDYSSGANDLYAAPGLLAFPEFPLQSCCIKID